MIQAACLLVLWAATLHRLGIIVRHGVTRWRVYLAAAVGMLALATTIYFHRDGFNRLLGAANIDGLATRALVTAAWTGVQLYTVGLRALPPDQHRAATRARLTVAAVAIATMTLSWLLAPIHDRPLDDLARAADTAPGSGLFWLGVYTIGFYAYLGWLVLDLGGFARARAGGMRRDDPAGALAASLVGVGSYLGIPVLALWALNVAATISGHPTPTLSPLSNILFPLPLAVLAVGLLMVPVGEQWRLARKVRTVTPLWKALTLADPAVRLPMPLLRRYRLDLTLHRRLIEIADALERLTIAAPVTSLDDLARAVTTGRGPGPSGKDLLHQLTPTHSGTQALLDLATAFTSPALRSINPREAHH